MEWLTSHIEAKVDIKDILAILVSLLSIWASTNKRVRQATKWLWSKTIVPIIDKMTGRTKTNHLINSLIESNSNFQAQNMLALNELGNEIKELRNQHNSMITEIKFIKSEIETNGGSTLKDGSNMIYALFWNMLNEREDAMILQADKHGNVTKCNRLFLITTGRSTDEVVGTGFINCIAPNNRERIWKEMENAIRAGRDYEGMYNIVDVYNQEYPVFSKATRLTDQKRNVIGYILTLKMKEDEN